MDNDLTILVCSCDKGADTFDLYHHCIEKYGPDHPEIIYSTNTIQNPYYKTICNDCDLNDINFGTKRVREAVKQIASKYIILMVDDIFLRETVDVVRLNELKNYINNNVAACILHNPTKPTDIKHSTGLYERTGAFKLSLMCSIGDRDKLIDVMDWDTNPGTFETSNKAKNYTYLINNGKLALNGGYLRNGQWFGICRGRWCKNMIDFANSEGVKVDFNKRGFVN